MAKQKLMAAIAWAIGLYFFIGAVLFLTQRWMIYPAPRQVIKPKMEGAKLYSLPLEKGGMVYALYLPPPVGHPVLVHLHGNAEQLSDGVDFFRLLQKAGIGIFAVEYPGYGLAKWLSPSETSCYQATETALRFLRHTLSVPEDLITIQGQSLGTGIAVEMIKRGFGSRLILISPYTSMIDMARETFPLLPVRFLVLDHYNNAQKAPLINNPVLILHGEEDEIIPLWMGKRLAELFPNAQIEVIEGAHHNDLFLFGRNDLITRIAEFTGKTPL